MQEKYCTDQNFPSFFGKVLHFNIYCDKHTNTNTNTDKIVLIKLSCRELQRQTNISPLPWNNCLFHYPLFIANEYQDDTYWLKYDVKYDDADYKEGKYWNNGDDDW